MAANSGAGGWRPSGRRVLKLGLTAVILLFVARHVARTRRDLLDRGVTLHPDYGWLAAAVGLYLLGLLAFGAYFWRVLGRGDAPVGPYPAVRAYLVSHLAKYVPGKAMVVVVRSALVAACGARPATAAFATLYETLTMMAAGGLLAAIGFGPGLDAPAGPGIGQTAAAGRERALAMPLGGMALGAGFGFLLLVWPSVFPRIAGLIRKPLRGVGAGALPRLSARLLIEGLAWSALGWTLLGLSQVAVIAGVGPNHGLLLPPSSWPVVVGSVALATVAGFAVPVPGGLGVREYVLWTALGTSLDRDRAVVAALVLRLAWVVGEVVVAALLLPIRPGSRRVPG